MENTNNQMILSLISITWQWQGGKTPFEEEVISSRRHSLVECGSGVRKHTRSGGNSVCGDVHSFSLTHREGANHKNMEDVVNIIIFVF